MSSLRSKSLAEIGAGIEGLAGILPGEVQVSDLTLDSRKVVDGGLFLACAGRRSHGLVGLSEARARGARAILWEPAAGVSAPSADDVDGLFVAAVPGLSRKASALAANFFDKPAMQLQIAGVTGTNGKTTIAWLLAGAIAELGLRAAYMGTLGHGFPQQLVAGEYTTEDAVSVQRQLRALRDAGAEFVAMEVSSHALDQARVEAVRFAVAAFSNLSRDHLDYHGSMAAYGAAKQRLFEMPQLGARILNVDDAFGAELATKASPATRTVLTCRSIAGRAIASARAQHDPQVLVVAARSWQGTPRGLSIDIELSGSLRGEYRLETSLVGEFNVDNCLSTLGVLAMLGIEWPQAIAALAKVQAPPGRMEAIAAPDRALAIVDYAHTPDALAQALAAARKHCRGKLQLVFGCGGDRDRGKRALMGEIAANMADRIFVTDDNPRSESAAGIVADILEGIPSGASVTVIHDREQAIRAALDGAAKDDVVLIAGKGHEDYQIIGSERRSFSDRAIVRAWAQGAAA